MLQFIRGAFKHAFPCTTIQEHRKPNYVQRITRDLLGWQSSAKDAAGGWSKGALTTSLCQFVEYFCKVRDLDRQGDERERLIALSLAFTRKNFQNLVSKVAGLKRNSMLLRVLFLSYVHPTGPVAYILIFDLKRLKHVREPTVLKASASRALNMWMAALYASLAFIPVGEVGPINSAGRHFLLAYGRLAHLSKRLNEPRFSLLPKIHMMWHVVDRMRQQARTLEFVENPLLEACAIDEDFIGRFCFLTRSVSPRQRIRRAMERYLTHVRLLWRA